MQFLDFLMPSCSILLLLLKSRYHVSIRMMQSRITSARLAKANISVCKLENRSIPDNRVELL